MDQFAVTGHLLEADFGDSARFHSSGKRVNQALAADKPRNLRCDINSHSVAIFDESSLWKIEG